MKKFIQTKLKLLSFNIKSFNSRFRELKTKIRERRLMPRMSVISHLGFKETIAIFIPALVLATTSTFLIGADDFFPAVLGFIASAFASMAPVWILIQKIKFKRFFKREDFEFLKQVLAFLKNYELIAELRGGARMNFLKGFRRIYKDIDLAVKTDNIEPFSDRYSKYVKAIQELTKISGGKKYLDWKVKDETEGFAMYVGLEIEFKFRITSSKAKTSIDVSFGRNNAEKDLRGEGFDLPISSPSLMFFTKNEDKKDDEEN